MFDNLRKDSTNIYLDEEPKAPVESKASAPVFARPRSKRILGMTAPQRFAIVFLLMLMVCVIGFMFLLVMGKIGF